MLEKLKEEEKERLLKIYNEYCFNEFDQEEELSMNDFEKEIEKNNGIIWLAYTETSENNTPVQTGYDTIKEEYVYLINEEIVKRESYSLQEFVATFEYCNFDDFISDILFEAEERESEEN